MMRSNFNPRTPHGVRHVLYAVRTYSIEFQSTHPTRGATQGLQLIAVAA